MQPVTTLYLAADTQDGSLVTPETFKHWADAYLAALTHGRGEFKRDADGYMAAYERGVRIYSSGAFDEDDDAAKDKCGEGIGREIDYSRYQWIEINVDAAGYLVCGDDESLWDSVTYGRQAGYLLRDSDAARAGIEGDEDLSGE